MKGTVYLYRGTTVGWPGNLCLQDERITCCTTDPLVACLFAVECRAKGKAIIYVSSRDRYSNLIAADNHFSVIECAVNLNLVPSEFIDQSDYRLDVEEVLNILHRLGFEYLPVHIAGKVALRNWLQDSYNRGDRLSVEQLDSFNREMEDIR